MSHEQQALTILYSDDSLLVIDKPAGLPTLPDGYQRSAPCLLDRVKEQYKRVWVVHRLDKDTSGVIVFARSAEVHRALNLAFDAHAVSKVYHAIVIGVPHWDTHTIALPLRPDGDRRHRTVIDPQRGKAAVTHCRVLERFQGHALLEAKPETGRTHQIRAHLATEGFPLVGDALYGGKIATARLNRVALHARSIRFTHPVTAEEMQFEAEYPADFGAVLAQLRQLTRD